MSGSPLDLDAYLPRLGFAAPPPPTLQTLRALQQRHTEAFPFETIATLLGAPVPIDLPALQRKLLHEGRGGYCFELNSLFLALLQRLGFQARALTARVVMGRSDDAPPARSHMLVEVVLDEAAHLVDVGFGGMVPTGPLRLDDPRPQRTPHEDYRVVERDGGLAVDARVLDAWRPLYVFDRQAQAPIDLEVANWYVSTHPASAFAGQLRVARTGPGERRTLQGGRLSHHRLGQPSTSRLLPDADAVIAALRDVFGLRVPDDAALRDAIGARLAADAAAEAA
ncbi:arylamine N-acetyltransferase family protein [Marilutibacter aestuarii]|uniref:Arylamine N-acetyltransferase n=1 Tax=Marilutibacter aestuarii TaxID=1706195 RepID=A0A508AHZ4_9GAMM|nr:arylamine N-acetyltransferase [Lysobacter aestuarii]TQD45302.1 arylamine N-acetyltransferase [Lysobacter aestuarii]